MEDVTLDPLISAICKKTDGIPLTPEEDELYRDFCNKKGPVKIDWDKVRQMCERKVNVTEALEEYLKLCKERGVEFTNYDQTTGS